MSHQFKPGDLALTLVAIPGLIDAGVTVEVSKIILPGDRFRICGEPQRAVKTIVSVVRDSEKFGFEPKHLMPLRGDFQPEQQKAKEAEKCA